MSDLEAVRDMAVIGALAFGAYYIWRGWQGFCFMGFGGGCSAPGGGYPLPNPFLGSNPLNISEVTGPQIAPLGIFPPLAVLSNPLTVIFPPLNVLPALQGLYQTVSGWVSI